MTYCILIIKRSIAHIRCSLLRTKQKGPLCRFLIFPLTSRNNTGINHTEINHMSDKNIHTSTIFMPQNATEVSCLTHCFLHWKTCLTVIVLFLILSGIFVFLSGARISPSCKQTFGGGSRQGHHISRSEHTVSVGLLCILQLNGDKASFY